MFLYIFHGTLIYILHQLGFVLTTDGVIISIALSLSIELCVSINKLKLFGILLQYSIIFQDTSTST